MSGALSASSLQSNSTKACSSTLSDEERQTHSTCDAYSHVKCARRLSGACNRCRSKEVKPASMEKKTEAPKPVPMSDIKKAPTPAVKDQGCVQCGDELDEGDVYFFCEHSGCKAMICDGCFSESHLCPLHSEDPKEDEEGFALCERCHEQSQGTKACAADDCTALLCESCINNESKMCHFHGCSRCDNKDSSEKCKVKDCDQRLCDDCGSSYDYCKEHEDLETLGWCSECDEPVLEKRDSDHIICTKEDCNELYHADCWYGDAKEEVCRACLDSMELKERKEIIAASKKRKHDDDEKEEAEKKARLEKEGYCGWCKRTITDKKWLVACSKKGCPMEICPTCVRNHAMVRGLCMPCFRASLVLELASIDEVWRSRVASASQ